MGEAGLGDQGSLFGGGEVGRGVQRLGVSGGDNVRTGGCLLWLEQR